MTLQYFLRPVCVILTLIVLTCTNLLPLPVLAQDDYTVTDQTPDAPLPEPDPTAFYPRYISGIGAGDAFTVFYENRDNGQLISYADTTTGPTNFSDPDTATNIVDTHFMVKEWPLSWDDGSGTLTNYTYRAWSSARDFNGGNRPEHNLYGSNDLNTWTLLSTFTIPNAAGFSPGGLVYYGFHDVIPINGSYYAWAETNTGETVMVRSTGTNPGTDEWEAFALIGSYASYGGTNPGQLILPGTAATTPTGSFFDLGAGRGLGKISVPGDDSALYLAINSAATPDLSPAAFEAAFIDPANWTWHDGTTGVATTPLFTPVNHDIKEAWFVPGNTPWTIIYTGRWASGDTGLGYLGVAPPAPPAPPPVAEENTDDDDDDEPDPTPTAIPVIIDPIFSERGDPASVLPGEQIVWTVAVSNNSTIPLTDVVVTDMIDDRWLILDEATVNRGLVTMNGQAITWTIGEMPPQEVLIMTLRTTVLQGNENGQVLNTATMTMNEAANQTTTTIVTILPVLLPSTGYPPD